MKSEKQKQQELNQLMNSAKMFAFDCCLTEENQIITHLSLPHEFDGPELKELPEMIGQFIMSFATISKQCEIYAGKYEMNYLGFINGRKVVDRPVKNQLETN